MAPISGRMSPEDMERTPALHLESPGPVQAQDPGPRGHQHGGGPLAPGQQEQDILALSPGQVELFLAREDRMRPMEEDIRWVIEMCNEGGLMGNPTYIFLK